jgi:hypothetical protein
MAAEIYVSTDVETDGPIPGPHSMLSFGSAAYLADKTLISTFTANLETLPGAAPDPKTMDWWRSNPEAWNACRENLDLSKAPPRYLKWLSAAGQACLVAYPVVSIHVCILASDTVCRSQPVFALSARHEDAVDGAAQNRYRAATKRNMPRRWSDDSPDTLAPSTTPLSRGVLQHLAGNM